MPHVHLVQWAADLRSEKQELGWHLIYTLCVRASPDVGVWFLVAHFRPLGAFTRNEFSQKLLRAAARVKVMNRSCFNLVAAQHGGAEGRASASVPVPGLGGPARGAWVQATEGRSGAAVGPTSDGRLVVAWDLPPPQTSDNVSAGPAAAIQLRGGEHLVSVELSEARDNVKLVVLNKSGEAWRWAREI